MKKLSVAYFGTPGDSARFLEKLLTDKEIPIDVKLVVTQPDKKVGKKQVLTPSLVKLVAKEHKLDTQFFDSSGNPNPMLTLKVSQSRKKSVSSLSQVDLVLLYAFGQIIPKELLDIPRFGFWNVHPSLLPKYRGASPVVYALINGEKETGVTLIKMDKEVDHGPIIAQEKVEILPNEKRDELTLRLTDVAFEMFKKLVNSLTREQNNRLILHEQDHSKATFTKILTRKDGFIEFINLKSKILNHPQELFNLFRGLYPWPGIWTLLRSSRASEGQAKRLKITDMDLVGGKLIIKKVQLEGKKEVDFKQFNEAYKIF